MMPNEYRVFPKNNFWNNHLFVYLMAQLSGPTDYSYFDSYPPEEGMPPDELSGWDKDF